MKLPARPTLRDEIIADVLYRHSLCAEDFFSKRRADYLVDARRDAAQRLVAAGFTQKRVAEIIGRDRETVGYYFEVARKGKKRQRARTWRLLHMLPNEHREVIERTAADKGISPYDLARDWLIERAAAAMAATERAAA